MRIVYGQAARLLRAGCDAALTNGDGGTPVDYACTPEAEAAFAAVRARRMRGDRPPAWRAEELAWRQSGIDRVRVL